MRSEGGTPEACLPAENSPAAEGNYAIPLREAAFYGATRNGMSVAQAFTVEVDFSEKSFIQEGDTNDEKDRSNFNCYSARSHGLTGFRSGAKRQCRRRGRDLYQQMQDVPRRYGGKENRQDQSR
jgi:hypothetical protein